MAIVEGSNLDFFFLLLASLLVMNSLFLYLSCLSPFVYINYQNNCSRMGEKLIAWCYRFPPADQLACTLLFTRVSFKFFSKGPDLLIHFMPVNTFLKCLSGYPGGPPTMQQPGAPPTMPQPGAPPGSGPQPGAPPGSVPMQIAPLPRPPTLPPPTSGVPGAPIPNSTAPPAMYQTNPPPPAGPTFGAPPAPPSASQPAFSYAQPSEGSH